MMLVGINLQSGKLKIKKPTVIIDSNGVMTNDSFILFYSILYKKVSYPYRNEREIRFNNKCEFI